MAATPSQERKASAVPVRVGVAGWSLPAGSREEFAAGAHQLQRYASRLNAVEINSSFHRAHARSTYASWASLVPQDFRFSVKVPRAITQYARLRNVDSQLDVFIAEAGGLGRRLGRLLVQLPPSLALEEEVADRFFSGLRARAGVRVGIACEPRHATWATPEADALWRRHRVARVAADPPRFPGNHLPAGPAPPYVRWHGSPRIYYDGYCDAQLKDLAREVGDRRGAWVIFDNTAHGHATANALTLQTLLSRPRGGVRKGGGKGGR